ncbi:MAG TPA: CRISPR-associated endonuclease Cas2 [Armatimonadota bacterium]|nr:CRISPR-associated endonuclease Cas2 [Armatimonadota bacterium]
MRQNIVVSYDVNTQDIKGARRLRRMAKMCKNYGQRVQYSVFECSVTDVDFVRFRHKLVEIIDPEVDSLRIYHLIGKREDRVESYGVDKYIDFDDALVV